MQKSEINTIFKKPGEARLERFVEVVAQNLKVYGISDDEGWALLGDDGDDTDILPLFQHEALAETFRKEAGFDDSMVEEVELDELMTWLEELEQDGLMVAVCPNPDFEGAIVEPLQLKSKIAKQISKK
jgi:hypothetical protein